MVMFFCFVLMPFGGLAGAGAQKEQSHDSTKNVFFHVGKFVLALN